MTRLPFRQLPPRPIIRKPRDEVVATVILRPAKRDGTFYERVAIELSADDEAFIAEILAANPCLDRHKVIEQLWCIGGI